MVFGFRRTAGRLGDTLVKAPDEAVEVRLGPDGAGRSGFPLAGHVAKSGRPVPFVPKGEALPVFFLHIPRSSGGTALRYMQSYWGEDNVVGGAEALLPELLSRRDGSMVTDVVAGHVPLVRWEFFTGSAAYRRVTVLRDPWARLVSHINRIERFNDGVALPAGPQAVALRTMAEAVARTDFASRHSMERLVRLWSPVEGGFDNLQVRMLLTGSMAAMVKVLTPRDVDKAVLNLGSFSVVGFCEDQAGLQRKLGALTGSKAAPVVVFENAGKPSLLSVRNEMAREVLEPWYMMDAELYQRAKTIVLRHPG